MPKNEDELRRTISKLNEIENLLKSRWAELDKQSVTRIIQELEIATRKRSGSSFQSSVELFRDKSLFPSRESLVAYIDEEFGVHFSPDWQRSRLEEEAA